MKTLSPGAKIWIICLVLLAFTVGVGAGALFQIDRMNYRLLSLSADSPAICVLDSVVSRTALICATVSMCCAAACALVAFRLMFFLSFAGIERVAQSNAASAQQSAAIGRKLDDQMRRLTELVGVLEW